MQNDNKFVYSKTIGQVAKDLEVSTQTIRNYLSVGDEFFSESATAKTRKRFNEYDVSQLRSIKNQLEHGTTKDDLHKMLQHAPRIIDTDHGHGHDVGQEDTDTDQHPEETPTEETPPPPTDLAIQYEPIIRAQQQTIQTLNDHINTLKSDKDRLQHQVDQLQHKLDRERLPWWRRLFGNSTE